MSGLEEEKPKEKLHKQSKGVWPEPYSEIPSIWKPLVDIEEARTDFLQTKSLRVHVATWNMHAKSPPCDLSDLFPKNMYHIFAVGTEECQHSIAKSILFRSKEKWENHMKMEIGRNYTMIRGHGLQAIHNAVFIHKAVLPFITRLDSAAVATGLGNALGNKGGVGISFWVGNTSFLFVNSHFEAHQNRVQERNENFHRINRDMNLKGKHTRRHLVDRFDRVFWYGDLNYRVDGTRRMVDTLLNNNLYEVLLFNEQLGQEMRKDRVFLGFGEGPITFKPTYKFDKYDKDAYDSVKKRVPSWTDRVLHFKNFNIEQHGYGSVDSIKTSDHRPVFAVYSVHTQISNKETSTVLGSSSAFTHIPSISSDNNNKQQQQQDKSNSSSSDSSSDSESDVNSSSEDDDDDDDANVEDDETFIRNTMKELKNEQEKKVQKEINNSENKPDKPENEEIVKSEGHTTNDVGVDDAVDQEQEPESLPKKESDELTDVKTQPDIEHSSSQLLSNESQKNNDNLVEKVEVKASPQKTLLPPLLPPEENELCDPEILAKRHVIGTSIVEGEQDIKRSKNTKKDRKKSPTGGIEKSEESNSNGMKVMLAPMEACDKESSLGSSALLSKSSSKPVLPPLKSEEKNLGNCGIILNTKRVNPNLLLTPLANIAAASQSSSSSSYNNNDYVKPKASNMKQKSIINSHNNNMNHKSQSDLTGANNPNLIIVAKNKTSSSKVNINSSPPKPKVKSILKNSSPMQSFRAHPIPNYDLIEASNRSINANKMMAHQSSLSTTRNGGPRTVMHTPPFDIGPIPDSDASPLEMAQFQASRRKNCNQQPEKPRKRVRMNEGENTFVQSSPKKMQVMSRGMLNTTEKIHSHSMKKPVLSPKSVLMQSKPNEHGTSKNGSKHAIESNIVSVNSDSYTKKMLPHQHMKHKVTSKPILQPDTSQTKSRARSMRNFPKPQFGETKTQVCAIM